MNNVEIREAQSCELLDVFALRYQRYLELGWINESDFPTRQERDQYDAHSVHFVAMVNGHIKGCVRIILSGHGLLPMEKEFSSPSKEHLELANGEAFLPVEVSRFIVEQNNGLPRHALSLGLLHAVIRYSVHRGITHWYQAMDRLAFRLVRSWHFQFREYAPRKCYMGSVTVPTVLKAQKFFEQMKEYDKAKYHFFARDIPPHRIAIEAEKAYCARLV